MVTCFTDPVYFDQVYSRQYLQGQPIAEIAEMYGWSLSDTAAEMQEQAIAAYKRRKGWQLEKESHWWYRVWVEITGGSYNLHPHWE